MANFELNQKLKQPSVPLYLVNYIQKELIQGSVKRNFKANSLFHREDRNATILDWMSHNELIGRYL